MLFRSVAGATELVLGRRSVVRDVRVQITPRHAAHEAKAVGDHLPGGNAHRRNLEVGELLLLRRIRAVVIGLAHPVQAALHGGLTVDVVLQVATHAGQEAKGRIGLVQRTHGIAAGSPVQIDEVALVDPVVGTIPARVDTEGGGGEVTAVGGVDVVRELVLLPGELTGDVQTVAVAPTDLATEAGLAELLVGGRRVRS